MRVFFALLKKEFLQIVRDPSSIIIAFVLPLISIVIYMYGINLDAVKVKVGIWNNDATPQTRLLTEMFNHNAYVSSVVYDSRQKLREDLVHSEINAALYIPADFSEKLARGEQAQVLAVTDGAVANVANYAQSYISTIVQQWLEVALGKNNTAQPLVTVTSRFWYNETLNSHHFILPGSVAVTMTLIGILLTALVVAREWERGTMEALLSTSMRKSQFIAAKYCAYFLLGMVAMFFNIWMCVAIFDIPFRGSYGVLTFVSGLFLLTALGIGLLVSSVLKNQFLASQAAVGIGFLPSLMLSGLAFPVASMPAFFQGITMLLPARHYVTFIVSEFLTGTVAEIVALNALYLSVIALLLGVAVKRKTASRLE